MRGGERPRLRTAPAEQREAVHEEGAAKLARDWRRQLFQVVAGRAPGAAMSEAPTHETGPSGPGWPAYNAAAAGRPVRPALARLLAAAGPGAGRRALDLGCGRGIESRALGEAGWRVTALDADASVAELVPWRPEPTALGRVDFVHGDFSAIPTLGGGFALAYAGYSLPFAGDGFDAAWGALVDALAPGAWLGVDLFGPRDSWARSRHVRVHDPAELPTLFAAFALVDVAERDEEGRSLKGPKRWHVLSALARKR